MKFKPRPYQREIIDHIVKHPRCAVFVSMGAGKSASTLSAIDLLAMLDFVLPVLIVAPIRVARSTWPDEIAKWSNFDHLSVSPIIGTPKQREAALSKRADIYTINFENLEWLVETLGAAWPFRMVVVDESTRLKGFRTRQGSTRAKALAKVAKHLIKRIVLLSGTPAPQGLVDLWGQIWFLDFGARLGSSFKAFSDRWFRSKQVGSNRYAVELVPMDHSQKEIENLISDVCLSIDIKDHIDLDAPLMNPIYVDLPPKARKAYAEMEKEMFTVLQGVEVEAFTAAAKTMKCLQLANGAIYTDESSTAWGVVHDAKIEALESIIEEANGSPVLVAYHFKSDLARLKKAFRQGVELDKNPQTIARWNAGKIPLMFAHPASAGHGLNLAQGGHILAFFSLDWNLENHLQIIERVGPARQAALNTGKVCTLHYIMARDTVDELILTRLQSKRSVQEILLDALKKRGHA